jgi:hypothetical protein
MSIFYYEGRGIIGLVTRVTTNTATTIIDASSTGWDAVVFVPWFQVNEHNGGTHNLTVDIYDGTNADYLGDENGATWNAKAVTAKASYQFKRGIVIPKGSKLRVTSSDASGYFKVIGCYQIVKQT